MRWGQWLDSLDSGGGHIAILLLLIVLGVVMVKLGIDKGEDVLVGAFGALLVALRTSERNQKRPTEQV